MKPITDFLPKVLSRAPGCAEPVALDAIRQAAKELCETSRIWRLEDSFEIAGAIDELMVAPTGAEIFEIESARLDERPLTPRTVSWLDEHRPTWRTDTTAQNFAEHITQTEPGSVRIVPRATGTLSLALFLTVSEKAEYLPDWMLSLYARDIADGAIAEVLMIPGQQFSNPSLASVHANRFQFRLDLLSRRGAQGQQKAALRTVPHHF